MHIQMDKAEQELLRRIEDINLGYMVMLRYWEPFQIGVQEIRIKWGIPKDGFSKNKNKTASQVNTWCQKYGIVKADDPDWPKDGPRAPKDQYDYLKVNITQPPLDLYHKHLDFLTAPIPESNIYQEWREATNKIRTTYFVPFHFQPYIERYILTGIVEAPYLNHYLHTHTGIPRNYEVTTKLYMYGVPSEKEMDYIMRHLSPMKTLIGTQYDLARHRHPHDRLKTDSDAVRYAEIFNLLEKEKRNKFERTDYQRAMVLYGERKTLEGQEKLAGRFRTQKSKALAKQRLLFTRRTKGKD